MQHRLLAIMDSKQAVADIWGLCPASPRSGMDIAYLESERLMNNCLPVFMKARYFAVKEVKIWRKWNPVQPRPNGVWLW